MSEHQCEHCDSDRKTREVYKDYWLCTPCEIELYDTSDGGGYPYDHVNGVPRKNEQTV